MSRNSSGTYTLPSGNPVVSGTVIEASWANGTLSDLADAMTDSLSRSGKGGMTSSLRIIDGTASIPSLAFANETGSGAYRAAAGDWYLTVLGNNIARLRTSGVNITGDLGVSGNATVTGTLSSGAFSPASVAVAGNATVGGTLGVTGNTTIGGTLGVTGVATLTANPVLNGGTANGVAYLNGSKVLTTGSVLTFDGTNLGVGLSTPTLTIGYNGIQVNSTTGSAIHLTNSTTGTTGSDGFDILLQNGGSNAYLWQRENADMVFGTNNAEQMRLTSTGLGIGTSSPQKKLVVSDGGNIGFEVSPNDAAQGYTRLLNYNRVTNQYTPVRYEGSTQTWVVGTAGTTRAMDLDASGNLGLGVTPSAWEASRRVLQIGSQSAINNSGNNTQLTNNFYADTGGTARYIGSGFAQRYNQDATGAHVWQIAPSGTAGNAISFTQAMTLNAYGYLSVGTTSALGSNSSSSRGIVCSNGTSDSLFSLGVNGTYTGVMYANASQVLMGAYANLPLVLATNNTERMRIDSSGNVGVGLASPAGRVDAIANAYGTFVARSASSGASVDVVAMKSVDSGAANFANAAYQARSHVWGINGSTLAMELDNSANLKFNSGYGSVATAYGCRAWVNFNGTGTVAIRASGNVSSITDNGTGDYTVNFTTAMTDANYAMAASAGNSNNFVGIDSDVTAPTAAGIRIACYDAGNFKQDGAYVCVSIVR